MLIHRSIAVHRTILRAARAAFLRTIFGEMQCALSEPAGTGKGPDMPPDAVHPLEPPPASPPGEAPPLDPETPVPDDPGPLEVPETLPPAPVEPSPDVLPAPEPEPV